MLSCAVHGGSGVPPDVAEGVRPSAWPRRFNRTPKPFALFDKPQLRTYVAVTHMKRVFQSLAVALFVCLFVGCVRQYPTAPPGAPVDVGIVSMHLKPQHPLPAERWRAVMVVRNKDKEVMAKDIGYLMRIPGRNLEIGRGNIGKILPDDSLSISSDDVQLPAGRYKIEAVLYLPVSYPQCGTPSRIEMTVSVGE